METTRRLYRSKSDRKLGGVCGGLGEYLGADPTIVATIGGAWGGVIGSVIALVSGQPPTLNPGDTFKITTPSGQPNTTGVVTPPEPVTVDSSQPAQDVKVDG